MRVVAGTDAHDYGDTIRTRFRYRLISNLKVGKDKVNYMPDWAKFHMPDVFDDDGIPVELTLEDTLNEYPNNNTSLLMICTYGIIPSWETTHVHRRVTLSIAGKRIMPVNMCVNKGEAFSLPIPMPLPVLVFSGDGSTCYPDGRKLVEHSYSSITDFDSLDDHAMAYGIASRLKAAEDSGLINERFATMSRSARSLSEAAATRAQLVKDEAARRGMNVAVDASQPFEIVKCDNEGGKDFAYAFTLRRRGGGAVTVSDYGVMRTAFRSAIRSHYVSSHPNINPRTLIVDFTEYALRGGVIVGRVAVLTISAESLSFDPSSRRGVVRVRIGEGQMEDARRWIRRNLVSLVGKAKGAAVPQGSRFYSEREEMRDGLLEVHFKTE